MCFILLPTPNAGDAKPDSNTNLEAEVTSSSADPENGAIPLPQATAAATTERTSSAAPTAAAVAAFQPAAALALWAGAAAGPSIGFASFPFTRFTPVVAPFPCPYFPQMTVYPPPSVQPQETTTDVLADSATSPTPAEPAPVLLAKSASLGLTP